MSAAYGEWRDLSYPMFKRNRLCYTSNMTSKHKVLAIWDEEAKVFTSQSTIPGLVVEADTFEEFVELVQALAPEVLEANVPSAKRPYVLDIQSHRVLEVA